MTSQLSLRLRSVPFLLALFFALGFTLQPTFACDGHSTLAARGTTDFLSGVKIKSHGKIIGEGTVDLRGTLGDISAGKLKPRDVFQNREGLLPSKPVGYYEEFVHPTPWVKGAGPERVVRGQGGELYYTADHYESFVPLN